VYDELKEQNRRNKFTF